MRRGGHDAHAEHGADHGQPQSRGDTGNSGAAARAPYCGNRWGSGAKEAGTMAGSPVSAVRAGVHGCFDRLGYGVRYVSKIIQDASGKVIAVRERRVEAEETKY